MIPIIVRVTDRETRLVSIELFFLWRDTGYCLPVSELMKNYIFISLSLCLTSCATLVNPDGSKRSVLTPQGSQIVQGLVGTAVGAGVGWAVTGKPQGALTGGISAGSGQMAGALIGPLLPTATPQSSYRPPGAARTGF